MTEQEIIAHVRDIVDGGFGRLEERVAGVSRRMDDGFRSTHKRIDGQAENIKELAEQVAKTNGKVLDLRRDVDALDGEIAQERDSATREAAEKLEFLHKRATDRADAPAVEHSRAVDVINEQAPFTPAFLRKYWKLAAGAAASLFYLGYNARGWLDQLWGAP